MVTASHLPINRNGAKFCTAKGGLEKKDIAALLARAAEVRQRQCAGPAGGKRVMQRLGTESILVPFWGLIDAACFQQHKPMVDGSQLQLPLIPGGWGSISVECAPSAVAAPMASKSHHPGLAHHCMARPSYTPPGMPLPPAVRSWPKLLAWPPWTGSKVTHMSSARPSAPAAASSHAKTSCR